MDILVVEMLGDIGKLHDQVANLKEELPQILNQMHEIVAAQTAKAQVLQEPIQRAIQLFISQEIRGIKTAGKEAQVAAVKALDEEVLVAVRKNLIWMQHKAEQSFEINARQFDRAVTGSATVAEGRATETLKSLCQGLQNNIHEIRTERWKGQYLHMLAACVSTGLVVGVFAVYILK
jgi:hypothetical protein